MKYYFLLDPAKLRAGTVCGIYIITEPVTVIYIQTRSVWLCNCVCAKAVKNCTVMWELKGCGSYWSWFSGFSQSTERKTLYAAAFLSTQLEYYKGRSMSRDGKISMHVSIKANIPPPPGHYDGGNGLKSWHAKHDLKYSTRLCVFDWANTA